MEISGRLVTLLDGDIMIITMNAALRSYSQDTAQTGKSGSYKIELREEDKIAI